ncbi:N-acetyltransferase [Frondihabitans sucicola]|uniref:N-acetyltransferase n=1 Tax=Frondihabitans sucicola TaxID=1268041 RepID=A0ABN6XWB9_9MICO|nr:GNAT family N-acetyltransferase [Frondihabitans sucicola]BDZ47956.1 N-acetyltransferase [Frondihabitans sucicola]
MRRATVDDTAALVELRAEMMRSMGEDPDGGAPWRTAAAAWFEARLTGPQDRFAAFVVDDRVDGVVSCAVGICDLHTPSPRNPTGIHGHLSNVSTRIEHRRRGHARTVVEALLEWFDTEVGATVLHLSATADGTALYESLGFAPPRDVALVRRIKRSAPR